MVAETAERGRRVIASGAPPPVGIQGGPSVEENPLLTAALDYAARRLWAVLPLHSIKSFGRCTCPDPACESQGKHPRTEHGFKDATTDEATIRSWWEKWPLANVGVATGAASGIGVLDVDPRHGGMESLAQLEARIGDLYPTPTVRTGSGGLHFFFAHPGGYVPCKVNLGGLRGLDFRSDGGLVCVAPSLHKSGNAYRWEAGPDEIALQPLPAGLLEIVNGNGHAPGQPRPRLDVASILDGVPEGERDDKVYRLACKLRRADVPEDAALELVERAAANARPSFDADRAREKVRRAYATYRPAAAPGCDTEPTPAPPLELQPIKIGAYDPAVQVPVEFGTPGGDVVAARGDLIILAAASGTGKTGVVGDAAVARVTGQPFCGFPCPGKGKAMIVAVDGDGILPTRAKLARFALGRGLQPADLDDGRLIVIVPEALCLDFPQHFGALQDLVNQHDPDLLTLDSLNALAASTTDLNDAQAVGGFLRSRIRPLALRPDGSKRTILLTHHLRKKAAVPGANALRDRLAGSYYLMGGADAVIGLESSGPESFTCRIVKPSRWGVRFAPFVAHFKGTPPGPLTLEHGGTIEQPSVEKLADDAAVVEALTVMSGPEGWVRTAALKTRLDATGPAKSRSIDRSIRRLEKAGTVQKHPDRRGLIRLAPTSSTDDEAEP
jgi:hypothetical protein